MVWLARFWGVTPHQLHRLFRGWAESAPTAFMAAIARDRARGPRRGQVSVLATACAPGRPQPTRLHTLFITHEAMSPVITHEAMSPGE